MGKDLNGNERGSCRVFVEDGDLCLGYILPPNADTLSMPSCRDCSHRPSTHKLIDLNLQTVQVQVKNTVPDHPKVGSVEEAA